MFSRDIHYSAWTTTPQPRAAEIEVLYIDEHRLKKLKAERLIEAALPFKNHLGLSA